METVFVIIVGLLIVLAISDLIVGVSNDAVNFLNSAVGSKAAPLRVILIVAALGVLFGATFSSGMMEVARKGIFYPGQFHFKEIMIIFLAVMLTDVILLDLFNTFGLPTSTTVSIVFELLGAAVGIAIIKITQNGESFGEMVNYINSGKALAIISGILLSVVVAFSVGALVMWLSRLMFSFNYSSSIKYFGGIFGGLAITAITYFILIKGLKGSVYADHPMTLYVKNNTIQILLVSFVAFSAIIQLLHALFKINILKIIVIIGTFALAMAFAGNDLVNFIGVPLAGIASYKDYIANGVEIGAANYPMGALAKKVETPTMFLLIAGMVMVITLWLSKKAKSVVKTTLNLSDQDAVNERFESSGIARSLVRFFVSTNKSIKYVVPSKVQKSIENRLDPTYFTKEVKPKSGISFDLVRASVNLVVASILISIGTSLKLPLSTTYVTFMVAMGTSLADGAWDRESAVYRITGVVTVVGGWFFTAFSAFTVAFIVAIILIKTWIIGIAAMGLLALFVIYRTHVLHKKREQKKEDDLKSITVKSDINTIYSTCSNNVVKILVATNESFENIIEGIIHEKRKKLKNASKTVKHLNEISKEYKKSVPDVFKDLSDDSFELGHHYSEVIDFVREAMHNMSFIASPCFKHVDNNHKPLTELQAEALKGLSPIILIYIDSIIKHISGASYKHSEKTVEECMQINDKIVNLRKKHLKQIKKEPGSTRTNILYLDLLNETKNLMLNLNNMYKAFRDFSEHNDKSGMKSVLE